MTWHLDKAIKNIESSWKINQKPETDIYLIFTENLKYTNDAKMRIIAN